VHACLHCCDWRNLSSYRSAVEQSIAAGSQLVSAFQYVFYCRSPADQLAYTKRWVQSAIVPSEPLWRGERYAHERIRIAYLSEDFRDHAVASLMAGVWEAHDRDKFETFAISLGVDDGSEMRARIQRSFEHFIDVRDRDDKEIAALLREREIDIVIDLAGYSGYCRPRILALKPAPVQVNYLGYPATMGADFIQYIIADRTLIGEADRQYYSENVVYLPDSYMPNDGGRRIAEHRPSRAEAGLPPDGFVFCSFNRAAKLLPETFDIWMRLLDAVDHSVLWLADPGRPVAIENLRREAEARGVSADRLIFAPHLPRTEDHLARLSLADLFLDTEPYTAHAMAADALWAGLPVLTLKGETFAGRVAASLLNAIGLPEMVAPSPQVYEAVALMLAREPSTIAALRAKLARNRETHKLFDTERFTRHLEAAYLSMWERAESGAKPESFAVEGRS
jgi:protein O-GlcNAc transferase